MKNGSFSSGSKLIFKALWDSRAKSWTADIHCTIIGEWKMVPTYSVVDVTGKKFHLINTLPQGQTMMKIKLEKHFIISSKRRCLSWCSITQYEKRFGNQSHYSGEYYKQKNKDIYNNQSSITRVSRNRHPENFAWRNMI